MADRGYKVSSLSVMTSAMAQLVDYSLPDYDSSTETEDGSLMDETIMLFEHLTDGSVCSRRVEEERMNMFEGVEFISSDGGAECEWGMLEEIRYQGPVAFVAKQQAMQVEPASLMISLGFSLPDTLAMDPWEWITLFLVRYIYQRPVLKPIESVEGVQAVLRDAQKILWVSPYEPPFKVWRHLSFEEADAYDLSNLECDLLVVQQCDQAPLVADLLPPSTPQILIHSKAPEQLVERHPYDAHLIAVDAVSLF